MISNSDIYLSIIIVTYKSNSVISNCLESITRFNDIGNHLEVILVDNSPVTDEINDEIKNNFEWVHFIKNKVNLGFGQGNNVGAAIATGRYLLFLNPDTILIEPLFSYVVGIMEKDSSIAVTGFLMTSQNGKYVKSFGVLPEKKSVLPSIIYLPLIRYFGITPKHIFPWGANLLVRRLDFDQVGRFDENFFLCYEEPDLVRRLSQYGKVSILNKSLIHLDGHTTKDVENRLKEALKSEKYYFSKYKLNYRSYIKKCIFSISVKALCYKILMRDNSDQILLISLYRKLLYDVAR